MSSTHASEERRGIEGHDEKPSFLLASSSARRRTLLSHLRIPFEVRAVECDESIAPGTSPEAAVCELALRKLATVSDIAAWEYVLTADTVVVAPGDGTDRDSVDSRPADRGTPGSPAGRDSADGRPADRDTPAAPGGRDRPEVPANDETPAGPILGKPADEREAAAYLRLLSGGSHRVLTGVALYSSHLDETSVEYEVTVVRVAPLSEQEISWYLESGEWHDAAGGYRIQEAGSVLVTGIRGSASNVIGLPMRLVYSMLQKHRYPFR